MYTISAESALNTNQPMFANIGSDGATKILWDNCPNDYCTCLWFDGHMLRYVTLLHHGSSDISVYLHCVSIKNAPTLVSWSFNKHWLIIYGKHLHTFESDMPIKLSCPSLLLTLVSYQQRRKWREADVTQVFINIK